MRAGSGGWLGWGWTGGAGVTRESGRGKLGWWRGYSKEGGVELSPSLRGGVGPCPCMRLPEVGVTFTLA